MSIQDKGFEPLFNGKRRYLFYGDYIDLRTKIQQTKDIT
jgi:hypothetical protein